MTSALIAISAALATFFLSLLVLILLRLRGQPTAKEAPEPVASLPPAPPLRPTVRLPSPPRRLEPLELVHRSLPPNPPQPAPPPPPPPPPPPSPVPAPVPVPAEPGLTASLDLDDVLASTLAAACRLSGVDAALVRIESTEGAEPLLATLGLTAEEAERHARLALPPGAPARSVSISVRYPMGAEEDGDLLREGIGVPVSGGGCTGLLAVLTRSREREFSDEDVQELEILARRAGPAIEAARRFREAAERAQVDPLTGLTSERSCIGALERELARAERYGRGLCLLALRLEGWPELIAQHGRPEADGVRTAVAGRIGEVIRSADTACSAGADGFTLILPEASEADARRLLRRLGGAVATLPSRREGGIALVAGLAELRPGEDSPSLLARARTALDERPARLD